MRKVEDELQCNEGLDADVSVRKKVKVQCKVGTNEIRKGRKIKDLAEEESTVVLKIKLDYYLAPIVNELGLDIC
jgi:hypothetical protein